MVSAIISRIVILVFGTLYPAYASYKAVKTKNVKEYVKWMMYWIVFAFFTCAETFADLLLSWLPFYYEVKIIFVLWMLSPATKGSNFLYRKFVHPLLARRESDIDEYITKVSEQGYTALVSFGQKGVNYATRVVLNTAMKGQATISDQLRKSYSMNDLQERRDDADRQGEGDDMLDNRLRDREDDDVMFEEWVEEQKVTKHSADLEPVPEEGGDSHKVGRSYSLREVGRERRSKKAA